MEDLKHNSSLKEQTLLLQRIMQSNVDGLAAIEPLRRLLQSLAKDFFPSAQTDVCRQALAQIEQCFSGAQYDVNRLLHLTEKRVDEVQTGQMEVVVCALATLIRTHPDKHVFSETFSKTWAESSAANLYQDVPSSRAPMVGLLAWLEHYGGAVLSVPLHAPKTKPATTRRKTS